MSNSIQEYNKCTKCILLSLLTLLLLEMYQSFFIQSNGYTSISLVCIVRFQKQIYRH